ncbi:MAG: hypothetical protein ACP5NO_08415, partial [Thermoplasmata archaeon]
MVAFMLFYYVINELRRGKKDDSETSKAPAGESKVTQSEDSNDFEFLQYKARLESGQVIGQIEWQIATIAITVTAGLLAAALNYIRNPVIS